MSSVPEGRRSQSDFQARHNYFQLRDEVTKLMINDFGFDKEKYDARIEKYRQQNSKQENIDKIVERWKRKSDAFNRWFVDKITQMGKEYWFVIRELSSVSCRRSRLRGRA